MEVGVSLSDAVVNWLYSSGISVTLQEVRWVIPTVQSIHIVAIAAVIGSALISDLRIAGVLATDETPRTVVRRYLPWMWGALLVLLFSGLILAMGEPDRVLANRIFWIKMALVLVAFALTILFRRPLLRTDVPWQASPGAAVKLLAWTSLALWVAVIFCGRWIAYSN
jgi:hypothetical protein